MTPYLLGIDVGTSVIKAALFDRAGAEVAAASVRTRVIEPQPGWSELDPETTWRTVAETCRAVLGRAGVTGDAVTGVGLTGVMVGAWLVDGAGAPVRPAILWNDSRAQGLVATLAAERPDLFPALFAQSGSVMQPWYGSVGQACAATFALERRHEPDASARDAYAAAFGRSRIAATATLDGLAPAFR